MKKRKNVKKDVDPTTKVGYEEVTEWSEEEYLDYIVDLLERIASKLGA
jgi:hypothetical protein